MGGGVASSIKIKLGEIDLTSKERTMVEVEVSAIIARQPMDKECANRNKRRFHTLQHLENRYKSNQLIK